MKALLLLVLALASGCAAQPDSVASREEVPKVADVCMEQDGAAVTESGGVVARDGECLTSRVYGLAPGQEGLATPEAAIRAHGFGEDRLTPADETTDVGLIYMEQMGDQTVGRYSVTQVESGGWVVLSYLASTQG